MFTYNSRRSRRAVGTLLSTLTLCSPLVFGIARPAHAWGAEGHAFSAQLAVRSLPKSPFQEALARNEAWFAKASSHPDRWRGRNDAAEAGRHFLDAEHFGHGTHVTEIPAQYAEVVKTRTYQQLRTDGIVPWTVDRDYKLLVRALRDKRWEDAFVQAAYLSHYVADSHVPFHASENYDGQLSEPSQKGIHSRFETQTLQRSIKISDLKLGQPDKVTDPEGQIFGVLQASIDRVPEVLAADRAAVKASNGAYDDTYWGAFTPKSRTIAISRLEAAGRFLAGTLQAAWEEAGKPTPPAGFVMTDRLLPYAPEFVPRGETAAPNPPIVGEDDKQTARSRAKEINIPSKLVNRDVKAMLLLPTGYDAPENANRRYPVLYLLHGLGGNYQNWNAQSGIAAYAKDHPFIIVMPDGGNTWYANSDKFGKMGDFFGREMVEYIDKTYRTDARREGRVIAGLSMGGYGAWRTALDNPQTFCAAASLSGAFLAGDGDPASPQLSLIINSLYNKVPTKEEYGRERLVPRIEKFVKGKEYTGPALYFDIGTDDFIVDSGRVMEQSLLERGVPYEFSEFPGKHDWAYWDAHIRDVMQFAERHFGPAK